LKPFKCLSIRIYYAYYDSVNNVNVKIGNAF